MAYHIHTTRAIILMSRAEGDGHKMLTLLTEDLGLLPAHAQSIRTQISLTICARSMSTSAVRNALQETLSCSHSSACSFERDFSLNMSLLEILCGRGGFSQKYLSASEDTALKGMVY